MKRKNNKYFEEEREKRTTVRSVPGSESVGKQSSRTVSRKGLAGIVMLVLSLFMLVSAALSVFLIYNSNSNGFGEAVAEENSGSVASSLNQTADDAYAAGTWKDETPTVILHQRAQVALRRGGTDLSFTAADVTASGTTSALTQGTRTQIFTSSSSIGSLSPNTFAGAELFSVDVTVPAYTSYSVKLLMECYAKNSCNIYGGTESKIYRQLYSCGMDSSKVAGNYRGTSAYSSTSATHLTGGSKNSAAYAAVNQTWSSNATYTFSNPTSKATTISYWFVGAGGSTGKYVYLNIIDYITVQSITVNRLIPTKFETEYNGQKQSLQELYFNDVAYPTAGIVNVTSGYTGGWNNLGNCIDAGTYKVQVTLPDDKTNYVFYTPNYQSSLILPRKVVVGNPGTAHSERTYEITIVIRPKLLDLTTLKWGYSAEKPPRYNYNEQQMKLADSCISEDGSLVAAPWLKPVYHGTGTDANVTTGYDTNVTFEPNMEYIQSYLGDDYSEDTWQNYFGVPDLDAAQSNGETYYCETGTVAGWTKVHWLIAPMRVVAEWDDPVTITYGGNNDSSDVPFLKHDSAVEEWGADDFDNLQPDDFIKYEFYDNANCTGTAYTLQQMIEERTVLMAAPQTYYVKAYLNPAVAATKNFVLVKDETDYAYSQRATYEYYQTSNILTNSFTLNPDTDSYISRWTKTVQDSVAAYDASDPDANKLTFKLNRGDWNALQIGTSDVYAFGGFTFTTQTKDYFTERGYNWASATNYGALWVPVHANIVLDLNGNKLDRHLTTAIEQGHVICIHGTLTIIDSKASGNYSINDAGEFVTTDTGIITGGYTSTAGQAGGILVTNAGTLNLAGGIVKGNYSTGGNTTTAGAGGIRLHGATDTPTLNVTGGAVVDNHATNTGANYNAGGIGAINGKVTIKNCFVALNETRSTAWQGGGGGIGLHDCVSVEIDNVKVLNNIGPAGVAVTYTRTTATPVADNIKLSDLTVSGNKNYTYPLAGGIYLYGGTYRSFDLENCNVTDNVLVAESNHAQNTWVDRAGGIAIERAVGATLTNCEITGNETYYGSGGVMLMDAGTVTMQDCKIDGNETTATSVTNGWVAGGMSVNTTTKLTMTDCSVSNNKAPNAYGGIFMWGTSATEKTEATFNNVTIDGNTSSIATLLVHYFATLEMTGGSVSGNTTNASSVIRFGQTSAADAAEATFKNVEISNNGGSTGTYGLISVMANVAFSMTGCTVSSNKVTGAGASIVNLEANPSREVKFEGCTFSENDTNGGYIINANNNLLTLKNCNFTDNGKAGGTKGVVYSTGALTVEGGKFTDNFSDTATIYAGAGGTFADLTVADNRAASAGAIYVGGITTFRGDITVQGNTTTNGAAVYVHSSASINMSGAIQISSNTGGNLFLAGDTNMIYVTGSLRGSTIYVGSVRAGLFTSGFGLNNSGIDATDYFFGDGKLYEVFNDTSTGSMEGKMVYQSNAMRWTNAIMSSLADGGKTYTCVLLDDWNAVTISGDFKRFNDTVVIDANTAVSKGYSWASANNYGGLTVPAGASVILDLAGYTINRNIGAAIAGGRVIAVNGTLTIIDSSATKTSETITLADGKEVSLYEVGTGVGIITGGFGNSVGQGGGIVVSGGTLNFMAGSIYGNKSNGQYGAGGVSVKDGAIFNMYGGAIYGNASTCASNYASGGVSVLSNGTFNMKGGEIYDNTCSAPYGAGGIYADGAATQITGGEISGNAATNATQSVGGILVNGGSFEISNTTVYKNHGVIVGGIYISGANVTGTGANGEILFTNVRITENYATTATNGAGIGGLYSVALTDVSEFFFEGCTINGNNARKIGGLMVSNVLHMENCSVSRNSATGTNAYGGVYAGVGATLKNVTVENNTSNGTTATNAAGIYVGGGLVMEGGSVSANIGTASGDTAGGIYLAGGGTLTNVKIDNNVGHNGAMYNGGNLTMKDCSVSGNGYLYDEDGGKTNAGRNQYTLNAGKNHIVELYNVTIKNNISSTYTLYAGEGSELTIKGGSISFNTVTGATSYAALWAGGTKCYLEKDEAGNGVKIEGNTSAATTAGATVYIASGTDFHMYGGSVSNNVLTATGTDPVAGVMIAGTSEYTVKDVVFSGNKGENQYNTVAIGTAGTLNLINCTVTENVGRSRIVYAAKDLNLVNCTVTSNKTTDNNSKYQYALLQSGANLTIKTDKSLWTGNGDPASVISGNTVNSYNWLIYSKDEMEISNTVIKNNIGIGMIRIDAGENTFTNVTFNGNTVNNATAGGVFDVSGGGVVLNDCVFTKNRGGIAGVIHVIAGVVTMADGVITGNESSSPNSAGAVYVNGSGTFHMVNGSITNNAAKLYQNDELSAGGIYVALTGTLQLEGLVTILDNTYVSLDKAEQAANIYVARAANKIEIVGTLRNNSADPQIGIYRLELGDFTTGFGCYNANENAQSYFASDSVYSFVKTDTDGDPCDDGHAFREGIIESYDNVRNWAYYVNKSLNEGGKHYTVTLYGDWVAQYDGGTYTTSFGTDKNAYYCGALRVPAGANITLELNGHTIDRNLDPYTGDTGRSYGHVISVQGTFTLQDSGRIKVVDGINTTDSGAKGVVTGARNFTLGVGTIEVSSATGKFTLLSGTISGNMAPNTNRDTGVHSGGVSVTNGAQFIMVDGTIENNFGETAGAVYVDGKSQFTMFSGSIVNNTATLTGGVHIANGGAFEIGNEEMAYEIGSNVDDDELEVINASIGKILITDNTIESGDEKNVYTEADLQIDLHGSLAADTKIGITRYTLSLFTNNYGANHLDSSSEIGAKNPTTYFYSDNDDYFVTTEGTGTAAEAMIMSYNNRDNWTYAVKTSCDNNGAQTTFKLYANPNTKEGWIAQKGGNFGTYFGTNTQAYLTSGALWVPKNANIVLDLRHHTIDRNLTSSAYAEGCVIYVEGTLTIIDSLDPAEVESGLASASVPGKITGGNNGTANAAGGIVVANGGTLNLEAGCITENIASGLNSVGGVYVYGSEKTHFTMTGGSISENDGFIAGGVYVDNGSKSGESNGTFTMTGGIVTANSATGSYTGGVRINNTGVLELGGTAVIDGNSASLSAASNLFLVDKANVLSDGAKIEIVEPFETGANIHITRTVLGTFTHNYGQVYADNDLTAPNPDSFFTSDVAHYTVSRTGNEETLEGFIKCDLPAVNWSYAVQTSINNGGAPERFTLNDDWTAEDVSDVILTSFGEGVGYNQGRLYVPSNASIILDLNGRTIDRNLVDKSTIDNGSVFLIFGSLTIVDSSDDGSGATGTGKITGGNSTGTGGIYNGGTLDIQAGSITGNVSTSAENAGGVMNAGTLTMSGGKVTGNYGPHAGVYMEANATISVKGTAYINGNFTDDTETTKSNLYFKSKGGIINVIGEMKDGASIAFLREGLGEVTNGFGLNNKDAVGGNDPLQYFESESDVYELTKQGTGIKCEAVIFSEDNEINWSYFVAKSLENGTTETFTLYKDWTAGTDTDYTTTFGEKGKVGYLNGGLYVPAGAKIILDLQGNTIDRALGKAIQNGYVFIIEGSLTIIDSTAAGTSSDGTITGGWSNNTASAIQIGSSGSVTFNVGNITGNKTESATNGAVTVNGTFSMYGGEITDNTGVNNGGVYIPAKSGIFKLGGSSQINGNTNSNGDEANIYFESPKGTIYVDAPFTVPDTTFTVMRSAIGPFTSGYGAADYKNATFISENPVYTAITKQVNGILEGFMDTDDNAALWEYAVQASLDNKGATVDFQLRSDWNATVTGSTTAFGTKSPYYINGALYVPVGASINFDLNGYALNRGLSKSASGVANGYVMNVAGELILNDFSDKQQGVFTGGFNSSTTNSTGGVLVNKGATFTMNGGHISGNKASGAGGGAVFNNGTFTMTGGLIGSFTQGDKSYSGNQGLAGAVYNSTYGKFVMEGGVITANEGNNAGGVFVYNGYGSFTMTGGSITNNTGISAGGVYVSGTASMKGGEITGNEATGRKVNEGGGSGVYITSTGSFTMTGGKVSENKGLNGIRAYSSGALNMGGTAQVYNNIDQKVYGSTDPNEYRNVYFTSSAQRINIVEQLKEGARIGVTRDIAGIFTSGYGLVNSDVPSEYFFSDLRKYGIAEATEVKDGKSVKEAAIGSPVTKPTAVMGLEYDATDHELIAGFDPEQMSYAKLPTGVTYKDGKFTAKNAGSYEFKFSPKSGYCWADGTGNTIVVTVVISPRLVELEWSHLDDLVYTGKVRVPTATVTNLADPKDVVNVAVAVMQPYDGKNAGKHWAEAAFVDNNNYTLKGANEKDIRTEYLINKATLDLSIENDKAPYKTETDIKLVDPVIGVLDTTGVNVEYTIISGSGLDATYLANGKLYATAVSGTVTIKADVPETNNYYAASATKEIELVKGKPALDLDKEDGQETLEVEYGSDLTLTVTGNDGYDVDLSIANGTDGGKALLSGDVLTGTHVGTVTVTIHMDENEFYEETDVKVTVKIVPRVVTLEWGTTDKESGEWTPATDGTPIKFTYNGKSQAPEAKVSNAVFGDELKVTTSGQTNAGSYFGEGGSQALVIRNVDGTTNPNYKIGDTTNKYQDFIINKAKLTGLKFVNTVVNYGEELVLELEGNLGGAKVTYTVIIDSSCTGNGTIKDHVITVVGANGKETEKVDTLTAIFVPTKVGKVFVKATLAETDNYYGYVDDTTDAGYVQEYIQILQGNRKVTLTSTEGTNDDGIVEVIYGNDFALKLEGTLQDILTEDGKLDQDKVTFTVISQTTYDGKIGEITGNGTHTFKATEAGEVKVRINIKATENYKAYTGTATVIVKPKPVELQWAFDPNGYIFDGHEQGPSAIVANKAFVDDVVNVTVKGNKNAGTGLKATATGLTGTDAHNYTLEDGKYTTSGTYKIGSLEVEVVWGNTTLKFNGEEQAPSYTVYAVLDGQRTDVTNDCELVIEGKGLHVGNYTATATGTKNKNYKIVPPNPTVDFKITKSTITLEITNEYLIYLSDTKIEFTGNIGNGEVTYSIVDVDPTSLWSSVTIDEKTGIAYASEYCRVKVRVDVDGTSDTFAGFVEKWLDVKKGEPTIGLGGGDGEEFDPYSVYYGDTLELVFTGIDADASISVQWKYEGINLDTYKPAEDEEVDEGRGEITFNGTNFEVLGKYVGKYTLLVHTSATSLHVESTQEVVITVKPRPLDIAWETEFNYDGSAKVLKVKDDTVVGNLAFDDTCGVSYEGEALDGEYSVIVSIMGSQIDIGDYKATVTVNNPNYCIAGVDENDQLDFAIVLGKLEISIEPEEIYIDDVDEDGNGTNILEIIGNLGNGEVTVSVLDDTGRVSYNQTTHVLTPIAAGKVKVIVHIEATEDYAEYDGEFVLEVKKHETEVELEATEYEYGTIVDLKLTGAGLKDGEKDRQVIYEIKEINVDDTKGDAAIDGTKFSPLWVGKVTVHVVIEESENFDKAEFDVEVTITPRVVELEWTLDEDGYVYNGTEQAPTATVKNIVSWDGEEDDVTVKVKGHVNAGVDVEAIAEELEGEASENYVLPIEEISEEPTEDSEENPAEPFIKKPTKLFTIERAVLEYEWRYYQFDDDGEIVKDENGKPVLIPYEKFELAYTGEKIAPIPYITSTLYYNVENKSTDECEIEVSGKQINVIQGEDPWSDPYTATALKPTNDNYRLADAPYGNEHDVDFIIIKATPHLKLTTTVAPFGKDLELKVSGNVGKGAETYVIVDPLDEAGQKEFDDNGWTAGNAFIKSGTNVFTPDELGYVRVKISVAETENSFAAEIYAWVKVVKGEMAFQIDKDEVIYGDDLEMELDFSGVVGFGTDLSEEGTKFIEKSTVISGKISDGADGTKGKATEKEVGTYSYTITAKGAGKVEVTIKVTGNDYYEDTEQTFTVTITPRTIKITEWADDTEFVYNAQEQYPSVKNFDNLASWDKAEDIAKDIQVNGYVDVTPAGEKYIATAVKSLNDNYVLDTTDADSLKSGEYVITARVVEFEWVYYEFDEDGNIVEDEDGNPVLIHYDEFKLPYTGKAIAPFARITNLPKDKNGKVIGSCEINVDGKQINVGTDYTATAVSVTNSNYTLEGTTSETSVQFDIVKSKPKLTLTYVKVDYNASTGKYTSSKDQTLRYGDTVLLVLTGNIGNGEEHYSLDKASKGTFSSDSTDLILGSGKFKVYEFLKLETAGEITVKVKVDETDNTYEAKAELTLDVEKINRSVTIWNYKTNSYGTETYVTYGVNTTLKFSGLKDVESGSKTYTVSHYSDFTSYGKNDCNPVAHWQDGVKYYTVYSLFPGGKYATMRVYVPATQNYEEYEGYFRVYTQKKEITIDWQKSEFIYNGKQQVPTVNLIGLAKEDLGYYENIYKEVNFSFTTPDATAKKGVDAGTYTATVTSLGDTKYSGLKNGNLYYKIVGSNLSYEYSIGRADLKLVIETTKAAMGTDLKLEVSGNLGGGEVTYQLLTGGSGSATLNGDILTPTGLGTVLVRASVPETKNYNAATSEITVITIGKPYAPIDVKTLEVVYGDDLIVEVENNVEKGQILLGILNGTGSAELNGYVLTGTGAGTATLTVTVAETATYQQTTIKRTVIIKPRPVEIEWDKTTLKFVYNGEVQTPKAYITSGLINGDKSDVKVSGGQIAAGKYTAKAVSPTNPNYCLSGTNFTTPFEIVGAVIDVSLVNKVAYIGDTLKLVLKGNIGGGKVTYTIINTGEGAAKLIGNKLDVLSPIETGEVIVRIHVDATPNTTACDKDEIVTIKKRELKLEFKSTEVIYGDTLELEILGNTGNGNVSYDVTNYANETKGRATIQNGNDLVAKHVGEVAVTVTVAATDRYAETTLTQIVTIKPRPMEIAWDKSDTLIYNGEEQMPSATVKESSLVKGDICNVTVIKGAINAGTANVAEVTELDNENYTVEDGENITTTFTILPRTVELEWEEDASFVYDGTEQVPTAIVKNKAERDEDITVRVYVSGATHANEYRKANGESEERALATATSIGISNYTLDNGITKCENLTVLYDIEQAPVDLEWKSEVSVKLADGMSFTDDKGDIVVAKTTPTGLYHNIQNNNAEDKCWVEVEVSSNKLPQRMARLAAARATETTETMKTFTVTAIDVDNKDYTLSDDDLSKVINQAAKMITVEWGILDDNEEFVPVSGDIEFIYNGYEQKPAYRVTGIDEEDKDDVIVEYEVNESPINAGEYTIYLKLVGEKSSDYTFKYPDDMQRDFKIVPKEITVTVSSKNVTMFYVNAEDFTSKLALKQQWSDWLTISSDELAEPDQSKDIGDIFDATRLFVSATFWQDGVETSPAQNGIGEYEIHMNLVQPTSLPCKDPKNYVVKDFKFEEKGILSVTADWQVLKLAEDSTYQFLSLVEETRGLSTYFYRKSYDTLGWTHGEDDTELERFVLGSISAETPVSTFVGNIDENQRESVRVHRLIDGVDTILYDCGTYNTSLLTSQKNIATGTWVELVDGDGNVLDTVYLSVLGDVSGDGYIDTEDASIICEYYIGISPNAFDDLEFKLAGCIANSGTIDTEDASYVTGTYSGTTGPMNQYFDC